MSKTNPARTLECLRNTEERPYDLYLKLLRDHGVVFLDGTVYLDPRKLGLAAAMSPTRAGNEMVFRGVRDRKGDPNDGGQGFIDKGSLFTLDATGNAKRIVIDGSKEQARLLQTKLEPGEYVELEEEDPTLVETTDAQMYLAYTHAWAQVENTFVKDHEGSPTDPMQQVVLDYKFTVGLAKRVGPSHFVELESPLGWGTKEVAFDQENGSVTYEQAYKPDGTITSTIAYARTPDGIEGEWTDQKITLVPYEAKKRFEREYPPEDPATPDWIRWYWINRHASPAYTLSSNEFQVDPEGELDDGLKLNLVLISARSESTIGPDGTEVMGPYSVGMALKIAKSTHVQPDNAANSDEGEFVWVSPLPLFIDTHPNAGTITFGCHYENGVFSYHRGDYESCTTELTDEMLRSQLPPIRQINDYWQRLQQQKRAANGEYGAVSQVKNRFTIGHAAVTSSVAFKEST
ncbi:MAG TPA: hypothetical protein VLG36_05975 [Candidatus Chromulinivoraceae bacterium]|nr:hypothetical protein [Candidatus Chromulinivoraceae bacterium]